MTSLLDFNTLEEAKAYAVPRTRLLSTDMLTSIMVGCGVLDLFMDSVDPIAKGTMLAMNASAEFNFILNNSIGNGHIEKLQELIDSYSDVTTKEKLEMFKTQVIGYCNAPEYPYKDTTLADWDDVWLRANPTHVASTYIGGDYLTRLRDEKVVCSITIDTPLDKEDNISIYLSSKHFGGEFSQSPRARAIVKIPAGYTGTIDSDPLNLTGIRRNIKVEAKSEYTRSFSVLSETIA